MQSNLYILFRGIGGRNCPLEQSDLKRLNKRRIKQSILALDGNYI
jgi:hypothetical protein